MRKGGPSLNPSGRPPKSQDERDGASALAKLSPKAVKKLEELMGCGDLKVEAQVALGIVKATIGELSRVADAQGNPLGVDFTGWTKAEILEVARSGK